MVQMTTLLSDGIFAERSLLTVNIVLNGSPFSVKRNIPNSPSACLPRLFLSTKKRTRFIGVYESILYAAIQAVYVLPEPVANTISARFWPILKLFSNSVIASYWQARKAFFSRSDNAGSPAYSSVIPSIFAISFGV